jgi:hypothetical protein
MLTVRSGPRVERLRYDDLDEALAALEQRASEVAGGIRNEPVRPIYKRFEPIQQVTARIELSGPERLLPSVRVGVDIRGDGSVEPYRGRIKRELIEERRDETAYQALRRAVAESM